MSKITKTDEQWLEQLGSEAFKVTRKKGTEYPGTGEFLNHSERGVYVCRCCQSPLFTFDSKFNAHCGWPAFDQSIDGAVEYIKDHSNGMTRIEILCTNCDAHLGHIFDDGPTETGKRYCVNSLSLSFVNSVDE